MKKHYYQLIFFIILGFEASYLFGTAHIRRGAQRMLRSKTLTPWITKQSNYHPSNISSASGCYFKDHTGKCYMDWTSGLMVVNLGHGRQSIIDTISKQLKKGPSYVPPSLSTSPREQLSERLVELAPFEDGKVFYTNAGADANEAAMFISIEFQRYNGKPEKKRILAFQHSFHGGSTYVASLMGGDSRKKSKESTITAPVEAILPNPIAGEEDSSLFQIKELFAKESDSIAAVIIEGSSGSAGCIHYPEGFYQQIEKEAKNHNILVIADEVMSGWGRTGKIFAIEHYNGRPDIITTAKGLTSGYVPLGAVLVDYEISKIFDEHPLLTGLTYSGHILATATANACLDLYLENNQELLKTSEYTAQYLKELSTELVSTHHCLLELRIHGLLGCFVINTETDPTLDFDLQNITLLIQQQLMKAGIFAFSRENFIFIAPPLIITKTEIQSILEIISIELRKVDDLYFQHLN